MIILVDKPAGITSAKTVEQVKKALRAKKAGHAGTLDPLATGLLIIATDADTKKLTDYLKLPKVYEADIFFGKSTDTGDLEGKVIEEGDASSLTDVDVSQCLAGMARVLELPVPAYSAVKQSGVPLYKKVRRGEAVEAPVKPMEVRGAELLQFIREGKYPVARIRFDVGSGTYIRSLAEELGRRLGVPATLGGLRRTQIGDISIDQALTLEQVKP